MQIFDTPLSGGVIRGTRIQKARACTGGVLLVNSARSKECDDVKSECFVTMFSQVVSFYWLYCSYVHVDA